MIVLASSVKNEIESSITTATFGDKTYENGQKAKEALIRSQKLINYVHEFVKRDLIQNGIDPELIYPPVGNTKPELKLAGFLKQKDQDVCVIPKGISKKRRKIDWGPLAFEDVYDEYGHDFTEQTLIINIRSQLSSLAKNADTLFERNFAEAMNLHSIYGKAVLGEVYMIPVYEYDDAVMKKNKIEFKTKRTNIEKYISFFTALNNRKDVKKDEFKYERVALLIIDFSKKNPIIYTKTSELKASGLVKSNFNLELEDVSITNFSKDLIDVYDSRFGKKKICKQNK